MDELFLMLPTPVAMPRAYWLDNQLSSQIVLIQPSEFEFSRIQEAIAHHGHNDFDMEIVNNLYGKSCVILPHRKYDLLSGEFRPDHHESYLGSKEAVWDTDEILKETKFVHFSDYPYPKPWLKAGDAETEARAPECRKVNGTDGVVKEDCRDREAWKWLYTDFSKRRKVRTPPSSAVTKTSLIHFLQEVCGRAYDNVSSRNRRTSFPEPGPPSKYEAIF